MGTNGWTASSAGEDLAKAVHHTCGGLPALPRAASPSLPARHLLRALWRLCVDSTPPELTEPVPADADGAAFLSVWSRQCAAPGRIWVVASARTG